MAIRTKNADGGTEKHRMQMTFAATEKGRIMATKIVRDNCKDCTSGCEHAGKDREFVCVKGVSCKTVKPKPEMVAVVRCKDCKYWQKSNDDQRRDGMCEALLHFHGAERYMTNEDFFCRYGERRTDANEPDGT